MKLRFIIADCIERHYIKGLVSISGASSCELCIAKGATGPLHWPDEDTINFPLRDEAEMEVTARYLLDEPGVDTHGIIADTPLYDFPQPFSALWSVPTEQFHLLFEGITKMVIQRTFEHTDTCESRKIYKAWNQAYLEMAVFSETPRTTRRISSSMKGSEFATIAFSAFAALIPLMLEEIGVHW